MAGITIRNLDDEVKMRLRARAARHSRSMEEEARIILREAVERGRTTRNLAEIARLYFGPDNGVDLELPPRGPMREPPAFDRAWRDGRTDRYECGIRTGSPVA